MPVTFAGGFYFLLMRFQQSAVQRIFKYYFSDTKVATSSSSVGFGLLCLAVEKVVSI